MPAAERSAESQRRLRSLSAYYEFCGQRSLTVGLEKTEIEAGLGKESVDERGRYLIRLRRVLISAANWAMLRLARLASDNLRCDQFRRTNP
jgi:hypothetical protein